MSDNLLTAMAVHSLLLADKYSVTDGCDSLMTRFWWFTTRPRGQPKWERGQRCTRPRTRPKPDTTRPRPKIWPWNRVGLEDLTFLIDKIKCDKVGHLLKCIHERLKWNLLSVTVICFCKQTNMNMKIILLALLKLLNTAWYNHWLWCWGHYIVNT